MLVLLQRMSPVMALSPVVPGRCLLLGVDRTCRSAFATSGFDPIAVMTGRGLMAL
jgi:hypothetical protein